MITRFFAANEEANRGRIERVLTLPAAEAQEILADLKGRYGVRHPDIDEIWMESFERVAALVPRPRPSSTRPSSPPSTRWGCRRGARAS